VIAESDLERPFLTLLETRIARELLQPAIVPPNWRIANTARGGPSVGQWSQPDLILISVRRYVSRAVPELELFGFELKTHQGFDVSAVHQALAHTRYVHYSHVVVHCPSDETWEHRLQDARYHAQRHGIGVIRLKAHAPDADFEIALHSERFNPAPGYQDDFLTGRLPGLFDWVQQQLGKES
jgi:hypothetical protein